MELVASRVVQIGTKRQPKKPADPNKSSGYVHSVLSFTRLEIPELEVFETAATFLPETDPLTAHQAFADVFGQKAGLGKFLFRADSTVPGRYWVQSSEPWSRWPNATQTALEPKRVVIQLAEGLMYRFTLPVAAGQEFMEGNLKRFIPYETNGQIEQWFMANAKDFGIKPLMANISQQLLRFSHAGQHYKVPYSVIEGALEVSNPDRMRRRILKGFGNHRRAGLGLLQLSG
jgi:CRISPR-associated protein Cas6/Cse3/CasE subtype I-E